MGVIFLSRIRGVERRKALRSGGINSFQKAKIITKYMKGLVKYDDK
jgi:hypothetical protein